MNSLNKATLAERFPRVSFGTSGVRALVLDLTPEVVTAYAMAFVQRMRANAQLDIGSDVLVGMDLRPSSLEIAAAVCHALRNAGCHARFLGALPTPALALSCLNARSAGVMVTGSHIPFDRNGIKFYSPIGEILKSDEHAIATSPMTAEWGATFSPKLPRVDESALRSYANRYVAYFGINSLLGLRVGVYEHSAVGRDLTKSVLLQLGATVIPLGRSDEFVPIDTEAVAEDDLAQARAWCKTHRLDAVVSTDGDGDRPLVFDEMGEFVRGDLLGLMCAREMGIQRLVVPVSCSTALERCGVFKQIRRTRIGSPFVIDGMNDLSEQSAEPVAGFEANGGFLLGASIRGLSALPTRDALLPMLSLLAQSARLGRCISSLVAELPGRYTYSDRIKDFPNEQSRVFLERLANNPDRQSKVAGKMEPPLGVDTTDGVRLTFADGDIVHLRASGNAPELRCYVEAGCLEEAKNLCVSTLGRVRYG